MTVSNRRRVCFLACMVAAVGLVAPIGGTLGITAPTATAAAAEPVPAGIAGWIPWVDLVIRVLALVMAWFTKPADPAPTTATPSNRSPIGL
jgi:hypothetical protein